MRPILILVFLIPIIAKSQFRDNFLGTYIGTWDGYDIGGHFTGHDRIYVDISPTDTNNIIITDSIGWLNYEYIVLADSTFKHIVVPGQKYGQFYSSGDSIFIFDEFNAPWYRIWHCGKLGASINEVSNTPFSVYPNPAKEKIFISSKQSWDNLKVTLFNSLGQVVLKKLFQTIAYKTEIDLPSLADGIYFLKIQSEENLFSQKIIIQN